MNTQLDEWEALSAEWRAASPRPESREGAGAAVDALRRRVRSHGRRQALLLLSEVVMTVASLVAARWYWNQPGGRGVVTALAILGMLALVWSFVIWNRRGSWRPLGESTREYVRLSRVRVRAGRRTVRFVRVVVGLAVVVYVPWFALRLSRGAIHGAEWWSWGIFVGYATAYLWWCSWYSRRLDREVATLRAVEAELGE
jgi:hypothetical protein